MAENVISDERVMNRARIVEINGRPSMVAPRCWRQVPSKTIEQAAIECAAEFGYTQSVVEVERDGIIHRIGVERVVTYKTTGLRGGECPQKNKRGKP